MQLAAEQLLQYNISPQLGEEKQQKKHKHGAEPGDKGLHH